MQKETRALANISIHNQEEIAHFLRHHTFHHVYHVGSIKYSHWPHTNYITKTEGDKLLGVVYINQELNPPTVIAISEEDPNHLRELLAQNLDRLPDTFYGHFNPGLDEVLDGFQCRHMGDYQKLRLLKPKVLDEIDTSEVVNYGVEHIEELIEFFNQSDADHYFDPRMVETGYYYGCQKDGRIASVAGLHVYSDRFNISTVGNVATHPDYRGQGLATLATAKLCRELVKKDYQITVNIPVDENRDKVAQGYSRVGFELAADYREFKVDKG